MTKMVTLSYKAGAKTLQINPDDDVFWVDGLRKIFAHKVSRHLIVLVAKSEPKVISTKNLFIALNDICSIGSPDRFDHSVHKWVHQAETALKNAGVQAKLISNKRGQGYRLADGWEIVVDPSEQTTMLPDLENLHGLIISCISHAEKGTILKNNAGLMYLDVDKSLVKENFLLIDRFGWKLIHSLSKEDCVPDVLDIKRDIEKLMSYVLFWRVGDGITEEKWRNDYKNEIKKVFDDIEIRIIKMLKHR